MSSQSFAICSKFISYLIMTLSIPYFTGKFEAYSQTLKFLISPLLNDFVVKIDFQRFTLPGA